MTDTSDVMLRIRELMIEGEIAQTPANYEFLYRYVTGADQELVVAIDAVRRNVGRLGARAVENIRREIYGGAGRGTLGRLLEDTRRQIERIEEYIGQTEADTRTYRETLDDGRSKLAGQNTIERQRAMLTEMIRATNAMLQRTQRLERELASSSVEIDNLKSDLEIARSESRTDPLTGLANRKACLDYLDTQILRAHAEGRTASVAFLDIDHFKRFNDSFGHRMGDEVLRLVAQSLERFFHGFGFPTRWGGEEFVIAVPGRTAAEVAEIAERFRMFIASRTVRARQSHREVGRITLSFGVAQLRRGEAASDLIDRADAMLYRSKSEGRNRVTVDTSTDEGKVAA